MRALPVLLLCALLAPPGLSSPPGGELPDAVSVRVTGNLAPPDLVAEAVVQTVHQVVRRLPGASVEVQLPPLAALGPEADVVLVVPVRVRHPYGTAVRKAVTVRIRNDPVGLEDPSRLVVSNNPERLYTPGLLLQERVRSGEAVRLLYHHQNATGREMVVLLRLANPGSEEAQAHLQPALPSPWHDTMATGHAAARRFLQLVSAGAGYVLTLPPRHTLTLWAQRFPTGFVASGLVQVQVLEGAELEVTVGVRPSYVLDHAPLPELEPEPTPHPRGVYGRPVVELAARLLPDGAGGVEVGASRSVREVRTGTVLVGDYGVTYRVQLELLNPESEPKEARIVVRAAGGPAYAAFAVQGQLVDLSYLPAGAERAVIPVQLPASEAGTVLLLTVPSSGSYLPLRLLLRS